MVKSSVILFLWLFIGFRLNLQWAELYEITYDITILLSSIVLAFALRDNHKNYMLLPFMISLPMLITDILNLTSPGVETITEITGAISALIIITYLLKHISYGVIR